MTDNPVKMILDQAFLRRPPAPKPTIDIVIRFGDPEEVEGRASKVKRFHFLTKEEADAFVTGVEAANGWMDYEVIEDGRYPK